MILKIYLLCFFLSILQSNAQKKLPQVRIVGGRHAIAHERPYMVALDVTTTEGKRRFCGGSIISKQHVLTSGHCVFDAKLVIVIIGAHDLESYESSQEKLAVGSVIIYPEYKGSSYKDDIAILALKEEIPITSKYRIVALAEEEDDLENEAEIMGWGRTHSKGMIPTLQIADVTLISYDECKKRVPMIDINNFCSASQELVGSCEGDGGGPLIIKHVQYGIISYPFTLCLSLYPTIYVDVRKYHNWIQETINT